MKKFIFENGQERLSMQMRPNVDFKEQCILWGCFDAITGEPLRYTIGEATDDDIARMHKLRADVDDMFNEIENEEELYVCPNTGYLMTLQGEIVDETDQNDALGF